MYEVGEYIVKPFSGVCRIEKIMHLDVSGADKKRLYYLLIPINDKSGKIYMPTDTADSHVRKAMNETDALKVIENIPEIAEIWIENEKQREQKFKEVIRSCNPDELVGIIKTLYMRKSKRLEQGKKNTAVDDRYFKLAQNNLYSELGFALHRNANEVDELIKESINQQKREKLTV